MYTDRLQNLVRKQGCAIAGLLLFAAVLGVRRWVVTPHLASLQASQRYESATGERIQRGQVMNRELRAQRARWKTLLARYASLSQMVFAPVEAEEFLSNLETLGERSGCVVASLSFLDGDDRRGEEAETPILVRGAALTVHGTYGNMIGFIEKLQARPEKVWIDKLHITALAPNAAQVACHLTLAIYVSLDEEKVDHENSPIQN